MDGETPTPTTLAGSPDAARDVVELLRALRATDTRGRAFHGSGRGGDLRTHDEWAERCIRESAQDFDVDRLTALWTGLRALPRESGDLMTHGDLIPANLLVRGDRLVGVLDGGGFAPADPALDLVCAWHLFDADARATLREALDVDDVQWARGAAWAFVQAMGLGWYYRRSNPVMSALGISTIRRVTMDAEISALANGS